MGYKVILAEKPSVGAGIAKVIGASDTSHKDKMCGWIEGNGYKVTWAFGHLIGLLSPEEMGFANNEFPFFPEEWKTKPKMKREKGEWKKDPIIDKQLKTIEKLFNGAERIIVATDAGREGELIFRYIYEYLGCTTPFSRLWISSLTDEAIRKGMQELEDGTNYDALSDAAHSRSQADWLVGYNASRALRVSTGFKGTLSLGRVQTPTLGMICQRYLDNKNFVPTPFWQISVDTEKNSIAFNVQSEEKYKTEDQANDSLSRVKAARQLKVTKVEKKRSNTKPPLLFDITSLQRAANSKFGMTAQETLDTAQSLYEKKFTTYPRTGSRYIPEDVFKTIPGILEKVSSYGDLGRHAAALKGKKLCKKSVDDNKITDHHALLPTGVVPSSLTGYEQKIYDLICGRMIEAFGEDYVADNTTVTMTANDVNFKAKGSTPVYMGWKAVFGGEAAEEKKEDETEEGNAKLPELAEGDLLPINKAEVVRKTDKPQPIYTDSSLLAEMETCGKKIDDEQMREAMKDVGLGTPATRAATIEALIKRGYIKREKKKLLPEELGMQIYTMIKGRKIADVKTTGEWERDLALVEQGKIRASSFNDGINNFVLEVLEDLQTNCKPLEGTFGSQKEYSCPLCGKKMMDMKYSISCLEDDGGCGLRIQKEVAGKALPQSALDKLVEGKKTALIKGFTSKTGKKFDACLGIDIEKKSIKFDFVDTGSGTASVKGRICPSCGEELEDGRFSIQCHSCGLKVQKSVCGVNLTERQIDSILSGKSVLVKGMKSKAGKKFDASLKLDPDTKEMKFSFDK